MLLHFHRKALALESIEGVDSDHIVVDGLTVVETSLQEGGGRVGCLPAAKSKSSNA